jgi:vancomycin permeability regulator SanA
MRFVRILVVLLLVAVLIALARQAGHFLVVDEPEKSDAIVVLAGDTRVRPAHALELMRKGMAPHVFLDAETRDVIYDQRLTEIAQRYVDGLGEANRVSVCPIEGFSTLAESDDARRCLQSLAPHRVLIVTSDFHTRRALMIFRHHLPQYQFTVAAASNPLQFGQAWWTNREWAKTTFDEWLKMLWWQVVDRWRS